MTCIFCTKEEGPEDPNIEILCSHCVAYLSTLDREQMRELIDKLYLSNKVEKAEFVEKYVTGMTSTAKVVNPNTMKVRIRAYKGLKPRLLKRRI